MIDPGLASLRSLEDVLLYELGCHVAGLLAAGQRLHILLHINLADRTIDIYGQVSQCCGSGSESVGCICLWTFLLSSSKNRKKNIDS
jgi:hypothetical protein